MKIRPIPFLVSLCRRLTASTRGLREIGVVLRGGKKKAFTALFRTSTTIKLLFQTLIRKLCRFLSCDAMLGQYFTPVEMLSIKW